MALKITVLMTVYNGEKYLQECIDSVLTQTFRDFEFLIVDDSSTDSSKKIVNSAHDARVRLIENQNNLGQVRSLNIGLNSARGEYIARIDQDDTMRKDRLKIQAEFLDRNPHIAVAGTWAKIIDEDGKVFDNARFPVKNEQIIANIFFGGYFLMHPSAIFRKAQIAEAGRYNEALPFAEDYDLWTRILLKKYKIANIPDFLIKFRYHRENTSKKVKEIQIRNSRFSAANFIRSVMEDGYSSNSEELCNFLFTAGSIKKDRRPNKVNIDNPDYIINLTGRLLSGTIKYFNLKNGEIYSMKKVFYSHMLNFLFYTDKNPALYYHCVKNFYFTPANPKLYLYPIKAAL